MDWGACTSEPTCANQRPVLPLRWNHRKPKRNFCDKPGNQTSRGLWSCGCLSCLKGQVKHSRDRFCRARSDALEARARDLFAALRTQEVTKARPAIRRVFFSLRLSKFWVGGVSAGG